MEYHGKERWYTSDRTSKCCTDGVFIIFSKDDRWRFKCNGCKRYCKDYE